MFHTARVKLTAWYLVIIMTISLFFSFTIYINVSNELRRLEKVSVIMQQDPVTQYPFAPRQFRIPLSRLDPALLQAARIRLVTTLGVINLAILWLAGTAGYFLAGRTLTPIQEMVDEQNRFISDASHELRTPLTALKAGLEVHLRDKKLTLAAARAALRDSITEVNSLQSLTDSLLALAQYQKPNGSVAAETVALDTVLEESIRKITPLAKKKGIAIKETLTRVSAKGIRHSLMDLFVILLDNAVKYSPSGSTIAVSLASQEGHAVVTVKDQGVGIPKRDICNIFDRFYRGDTARTKNGDDGYGLGLAIAKQIVDAHHGKISVTSVVGKGSIFTVTLP